MKNLAHVESVKSTNVYNTHTDHLGSSSILTAGLSFDGTVTTATGGITQQLDSFPYGEERLNLKSASHDTPKKYTGKELDEETGLYYYGARYYDSRLGRFVSEDPVGRDTSDIRLLVEPQRWNMYSYALNNPLRYNDPTGGSSDDVCSPGDAPNYQGVYNTIDQASAFMYEYTDAIALDLLPDVPYSTQAGKAGATAGNKAAEFQGQVEMITGAVMTTNGTGTMAGSAIAGAAACAATAGGGCVAGVAGVAAGGAEALGGVTLSAHGYNSQKNAKEKLQKMENTGRVQNPSKGESSVWKKLQSYRDSVKTNGSKGSQREYYKWDYTHNNIEVYDGKGVHKGVMDPSTGNLDIAKRVNGRSITKEL